jgi:hypothetical protein
VIQPGDRVPDVGVWLATGADPTPMTTTGELARNGAYLLLFYLYDWTST